MLAGLRACRLAGLHACGFAGLHAYVLAGLHACGLAGLRDCALAGLQACGHGGLRDYGLAGFLARRLVGLRDCMPVFARRVRRCNNVYVVLQIEEHPNTVLPSCLGERMPCTKILQSVVQGEDEFELV